MDGYEARVQRDAVRVILQDPRSRDGERVERAITHYLILRDAKLSERFGDPSED